MATEWYLAGGNALYCGVGMVARGWFDTLRPLTVQPVTASLWPPYCCTGVPQWERPPSFPPFFFSPEGPRSSPLEAESGAALLRGRFRLVYSCFHPSPAPIPLFQKRNGTTVGEEDGVFAGKGRGGLRRGKLPRRASRASHLVWRHCREGGCGGLDALARVGLHGSEKQHLDGPRRGPRIVIIAYSLSP